MSPKHTPLVAKKIKKARKEAGFSQKELARKLKVSDKTVSAYEIGKITPNFTKMRQISKITHKSISYFDPGSGGQPIDLQLKIKIIEKELAAIKKILSSRGKN
jgi:transcriptional regulator with XRE-family HTH domain